MVYNNKWISCLKKQPEAKLRIFCFPYAGGGATVYYKWYNSFSEDIEICAVRLPGRESRIKEKPYRNMANLIEKLAVDILPLFDKPFLLFGHSLGAHISYHLARFLRRNSMPCPKHLFVSGARAPHMPKDPTELHYEMEEKRFIKGLIELGGMPEELLKNRELLDLFLPTLRADIEVLNTVDYSEEEPLDCGITSFGGVFDPKISREESEAWSKHTNGKFRHEMIPGEHLFINTHREQLINFINHDIQTNLDDILLIDHGLYFNNLQYASGFY